MASSADLRARWAASAQLARLIIKVRRMVWRAASRALMLEGETVIDWQIVNQLALEGPSTQRALSDAIGQHPAGVSRQLEELESKGHVKRERSHADRRCSVVRLTPKGKRWHEAHQARVEEAVHAVLGELTPLEHDGLEAVLLKLLAGEAAALESLPEPAPKKPSRTLVRS